MKDGVEVSVYMIVHNGARFIRAAVDSILAQSFPDFEFVVIDDGSTDSSPEILASYRDPRLRVIHQENQGRPRARNRALAECQGRFIAVIDSDDLAKPERLARQVEYLRAHPEIGVLGADHLFIDEMGRTVSRVRLPPEHEKLRRLIVIRNSIPLSAAMFRKDVADAIGGYDETFVFCQDHDFLVRAAARFRFAALPEVLAARRIHGSMIMMTRNRENMKHAMRVRRRAIQLFGMPWYYHFRYFHLLLLILMPQWMISLLLRIRCWLGAVSQA